MKKTVSELNVGKYTASVDEDGTLQVRALDMRDPLLLDAQQVETLFRWLAEFRDQPAKQAPVQAPAAAPVVEPEQSPQEVALNAIRTAIAVAREQYPSSLDPVNRDRFIEQIARNPVVRPLMSQGKVNRRQLTLWVEQELE